MERKNNPTLVTKVLVKKIHGGRKQDSKFWRSEFDGPNIPIPEKKAKSRVQEKPFLFVGILFLLSLAGVAFYYLFINEKPYVPLSRVYEEKLNPYKNQKPKTKPVPSYITEPKSFSHSQRTATVKPTRPKSNIYSWTDSKGNKHFSNIGPPQNKEYDVQPEYDSYSKVTKIKVSGNSVYVPVTYSNNGKSLNTWILLDTGCTTTVLSHQTADYLDAEFLGKTSMTVADGRKVSGYLREIDSIKVGPSLEKEFTVISQKRAGADNRGLLGLDFLKKHPHKIDYKNQIIVWE